LARKIGGKSYIKEILPIFIQSLALWNVNHETTNCEKDQQADQ